MRAVSFFGPAVEGRFAGATADAAGAAAGGFGSNRDAFDPAGEFALGGKGGALRKTGGGATGLDGAGGTSV
jgi:hypothetical protein